MANDAPGSAMIDHLVYAVTDLSFAVQQLNQAHGIALPFGGAHQGMGTCNHLGSLGGSTYLEVIGADPDQPEPDAPRPFGIDSLEADALTSWCVRPPVGMQALHAQLAELHLRYTQPLAMSRQRPDGVLLEWQLMLPEPELFSQAFPFFIDWGNSPHPSENLVGDLALTGLQLRSPRAEALTAVVNLVLADPSVVAITEGDPELIATVAGPSGAARLGAAS